MAPLSLLCGISWSLPPIFLDVPAVRYLLQSRVALPVMSIGAQLAFLFILAIPIACIAWTVTHEEVFREPREFCQDRSQKCDNLVQRKFFYLFTCEYCFSHYVTVFFLFVTRFQLLYDGWRGYLIAGFALVWVANIYMNLYSRIRLDIKKEKTEIEVTERSLTR